MPYEHLRFQREEPVKRRRPGGAPRISIPENPAQHGQRLANRLLAFHKAARAPSGAADGRHLLKLELTQAVDPDLFEAIPGVEVISQEEKQVLLAFATADALLAFEQRINTLAAGGRPVRKEILFALADFANWTSADRQGWALAREGFPLDPDFYLDIELWPLHAPHERAALREAFVAWIDQIGIIATDTINLPGLQMWRVRCTRPQADLLLEHRDVRSVNLPPRFGLMREHHAIDIADLPRLLDPPDDAPSVVILDSGLATGHPLLRSCIGDAQGFVPPARDASDGTGHGTMVAGVAVYGDVAACADAHLFEPKVRLFSGRVLDDRNEYDPSFIENHIREAVEYFHGNYGCRIFNLSVGDLRRPYLGGHVGGLAYVLDCLAREYSVLFVVSGGNFSGSDGVPADWRGEYPEYLLDEAAAILDPAPALNAITVGSLAKFEATYDSQRYPRHIEDVPIAATDQPSPFTRSGRPGRGVKPEVAAYGGNWALNARYAGQPIRHRGLGVLSLNHDFATGSLFREDAGTSFAAPYVAHLAARLAQGLPQADPLLIRALLIAHAKVPKAAAELLASGEECRRIIGFGAISEASLLSSSESEVTLYSLDSIEDRHHHFYELPTPEEYYEGKRRIRELVVALSHCPSTRTTRVDYRATRISFKLVEAESLDEVTGFFNAAVDREDVERIPEINGRSVSERDRSRGSAQASTWRFRQFSRQRRRRKLFVVVTRFDAQWSAGLVDDREEYALALVYRDADNGDARLYQAIRARLEIRARPRVRL